MDVGEPFQGNNHYPMVCVCGVWPDNMELGDCSKIASRHIPAKTSLKPKNGTDYKSQEHFQFSELRKTIISQ